MQQTMSKTDKPKNEKKREKSPRKHIIQNNVFKIMEVTAASEK